MGIVKFVIIFDRPNKIYKAGETMTGRIELVLSSSLKIRGVALRFTGKGKCKWKQTNYNCETEIVTLKQKYIDRSIILCGGEGTLKLQEEYYAFPFSVKLPHDIPPTFSDSYGNISYCAKAKIDIPMGFDETVKEWFTVINPLDLNNKPALRNPYKKQEDTTFISCLFCESGPLTIVLYLPKTGFAKSESIPIMLEMDNASNFMVDRIIVRLRRLIKYKGKHESKHKRYDLNTLCMSGVDKRQSRTCSGTLTIPSIEFPNLEHCSIINFSHNLKIEAIVLGTSDSLIMKVDICIGDIPFSEDFNAPVVDSSTTQLPNTVPFMPEIPKAKISPIPSDESYTQLEEDSNIPKNPSEMPIPGIPHSLPQPVVSPRMPPNIGFDSMNLNPKVEMPDFPDPKYLQQNLSSHRVPSSQSTDSSLSQHSRQNGTINDPAQQSAHSSQPNTKPEYAENTQNSDLELKAYFSSSFNSDFSLPKFTTSDIQIEPSTFLSNSKGTDNKDNKATQFTSLFPSYPPASPPPSYAASEEMYGKFNFK